MPLTLAWSPCTSPSSGSRKRNADIAVVLLFGLVASGQIKLRRVDGWQKIAAVLSQRTAVAA